MRSPPWRAPTISARAESRRRLRSLNRAAVRQGQRRAAVPVRSASRVGNGGRARPACSRSRQRAHDGAVPGELGLGIVAGAEHVGFDLRDAFCRQRRQAEARDPAPQHARAARGRQCGAAAARQAVRIRRARHRRAPRASDSREQVAGIGAAARPTARERGIGVRPALAQQRQHALAQEVAVVARCRRCWGRRSSAGHARARTRPALSRRVIEQGPPEPAVAEPPPATHRRQAFRSRRAQRAQQQGLGLVVAVMRQRQHFVRRERRLERGMARRARGRLQALSAALDHHLHHGQRNVQRLAGPRCNAPPTRRPGGAGRGARAPRAIPARRCRWRRQVQQHGRIQAAAESHAHRRIGPVVQGVGQSGGVDGSHALMVPRPWNAATHW